VRREFDDLLTRGSIATCDMVRFELLWSARNHAELAELRAELDALRDTPIGARVWRRALDVFEALAQAGPLHHRRVRPPDLLIAAAAERAELTVLHHDHHFDLIAEVTGQSVRAIAPLGSL
jgi:predicted nucleic acid-binding protein